jgi:hypothetical protein
MTICIAAICNNGQAVVVAADRMFTAGPPLNLEFEPPVSKLEQMTPGCLALAAGQSVYASEILRQARDVLHTEQGAKVLQITDICKRVFITFRNGKIEEQLINLNLGPDFALFRERGLSLPSYLQAQPGIYQNLVIQMNQFNLNVELMFAGNDEAGGHIYHLTHPGTVLNYDKLGYNAIGSGGIHAMTALHLGKHSPKSSLSETIYSVYNSKIAAEKAPGVGTETEMAVIANGEIRKCSTEFITEVGNIHNSSIKERKPDLNKIEKLYAEQRSST